MKIIKHCNEEGGPSAECQGALLGLVKNGTLEVTNCFGLPSHAEDDDMDDSKLIFSLSIYF